MRGCQCAGVKRPSEGAHSEGAHVTFFAYHIDQNTDDSAAQTRPQAGSPPVCTKNLNPDVMVMKSDKDRFRSDGTDPLNWARDRRILVQ